jgi:tyrosine decarboxylase/aspartate 1-decarboxylase
VEEAGRPAEAIRAELRRLRDRDMPFRSGRVLGSMCTAPHPIAVEAYTTFLETNLGDPWLNPGARDAEERAQASILQLLRGPEGAGAAFVSGGSEANFTALLVARTKTGRREIVLPESAHFSFEKACFYLGLTPRYVPTLADGRADVEATRTACGPRTAAVVGVAGTTELGCVDDIAGLARCAVEVGAHMHVDAAFGGFVIPFAKELGRALPDFDFGVAGVGSIAIDPHKMGLAPIPAGVLAVADRGDLTAVSKPSPYVSAERQPSLQGTRPGAAAVAAWAVMAHLGREGYRRVVAECLDTTGFLVDALKSRGIELVRDPPLTIVAFRLPDPGMVRRLLAESGFLVGLAPLARGLKVVVMPHVKREAVSAFLPALDAAHAKVQTNARSAAKSGARRDGETHGTTSS